MLVRKCDNCGREFRDGDTVYIIKRIKAKYTEFSIDGECKLNYDPHTGKEEEWCERCASIVNNALQNTTEGEVEK